MGVDLRLIPMANEDPKCDYSEHFFEVNRDTFLFNHISFCADTYGRQVPTGGIKGYGARDKDDKEIWGAVERDCYGKILKSITAKQLIETIECFVEYHDADLLKWWGNKALLEYFKHVPENLSI